MGTAGATITVPTGPAVFCGATGVTISGVAIAVGEGEAAVSVPGNGELALTSCEVRNGAGDGVQVFGQCTLTSCKVLECGAYGVSVLAGGEAATENTTIGLHKKTGVLSRGKGSRISLGAGTIVEKNKLHGVGADQGGSFTAISTTVRENGFVGVNLGDWGSGQLTDCKIYANGMHGIQVPSTSVHPAGSTHAHSSVHGNVIAMHLARSVRAPCTACMRHCCAPSYPSDWQWLLRRVNLMKIHATNSAPAAR
jgi:hypothetical protein